jgi:hypothetical protein
MSSNRTKLIAVTGATGQMNTSLPQKLVQAVNVTTPIQYTTFVTDSPALSREKSEPSELKLDSWSERNFAAGDHDTQGGFVNEQNFLFVFPLALFVVFVIFGVALWMG